MNNVFVKQFGKVITAMSLLLLLLLNVTSAQAAVTYENNISCTPTGTTGYVDLGTVAPNQVIKVVMTANCKVTRWFPVGASLGHTQYYHMGKANPFVLIHANTGKTIPQQDAGTSGTTCVPTSCVPLAVGTQFSYDVLVAGNAGSATGRYMASVTLNDTSINGWEAYGDYLQTLTINYTVSQPSCSMGSAKTLSLPFGTLSSNDFASAQQIASITMNCTKGTQATATLVPTQSAVSGQMGVSATTLDGLSMAATWADTNTAVTFNSPRTLALNNGDNTISLGFRPVLNGSVSPAGNFASQYTLSITYL